MEVLELKPSFRKFLLDSAIFRWAYRQGGIDSFPLAQKDILETMRDDLDKQANELADKKLEQLLTIVDYSQIVGQKGKTVYIGGVPADEALLANLKAEAKFLLESELWKLISETPKELAQRAMFKDDGQLENLLLKGRAVLYTLATQKKIIDLFNSI